MAVARLVGERVFGKNAARPTACDAGEARDI
jgi:hypothetical protein